jgi:signal transduction histidine kinase
LAVDDDADMLAVIRRVLSHDHDLTLVLDAREALRLALLHPPDVILSDVVMPGMDGLEFLQALHSHASLADVPVIVLSGGNDQETRLKMLRAGAQEFLMKPCAAEELRVRIHNTLKVKIARDLLRDELKVQSTDIEVLVDQVASRGTALKSALAAAERASQAKSAFLTLISHELGGPLTVLRLTADSRRLRAQRAATPLDPSARRSDEALTRLEAIVETVIELVKLQGGSTELHFEKIDVERLLREVVTQFEARAEAKGLRLTVDVAPDARSVTSDRRLLRMLLCNLASNAVKFTEAGAVTVSSVVRGGTILAVQDTGRGIKAGDQARILEPFGFVEAINRKSTPGIGLGLALVRELVLILGGSLALTSELGVGSTFSVTLPIPVRSDRPEAEVIAARH